jgi:hypothetical protein
MKDAGKLTPSEINKLLARGEHAAAALERAKTEVEQAVANVRRSYAAGRDDAEFKLADAELSRALGALTLAFQEAGRLYAELKHIAARLAGQT